MTYFLGVDLGQSNDFTALAVLDKTVPYVEISREMEHKGVRYLQPGRQAQPPVYACPLLERVPRETPYPEIVDRVHAMMHRRPLVGSTRLVVDATGVGRPVVDMLRRRRLDPIAITITGGDAVSRDGSGFRVPKRDLVGVLQVLLQTQRLKFASGLPSLSAVVQELLAFRVTLSPGGHDSYAAHRESDHDDLVLALAVAAWYGERERPAAPPPRSRSYHTL